MADSQARIVISASDKTRAAIESAKANFGTLQAKAAAVGGVISAAFAGVGLAGLVTSTARAIDELNDAADATGSSVEMLSALDDLARRTGTTLDSVTGILVKFNAVLNEAKPGSEAEAALKAIGLQADELRKQDPADALRQVATALTEYEDDANKARLVQLLFGKSIREVAPFLKDLAEAGTLNSRMTAEQAAEAERFNKQLAALQTNSENATRQLVSGLLPTINELLEAFSAAKDEAGGLAGASDLLRVPFEALIVLGANLAYVFKGFGNEIGGIAAQISRLAVGDFRGAGAIRDAMLADAEAARKKLDDFERRILSRTTATESAAGGGFSDARFEGSRKRSVGTLPTPAKAGAAETARAFTDYQQLIDQSVGNLLEDADVTRAQKINDQIAKLYQLFQLGMPADLIGQAQAKLNEGKLVGPELPPEEIDRRKRLNDLIAATPTAKLDESRKQMQLLADAFERGDITAMQFEEAAGAALGTLPDQIKTANDGMDEFAKQAARNIQDALGTSVKAALKGDFDGILDLWGNMLAEMAAQALAAQLGKFLFGDFGTTGSIGGVAGDLFAAFAGFFADGGRIPAGQWGIAGEAGAEVIQGPATVTPLAQLPAAPGGGALQFAPQTVVNIDSRSDAASVYAGVQRMLQDNNKQLFAQLRTMGVVR